MDVCKISVIGKLCVLLALNQFLTACENTESSKEAEVAPKPSEMCSRTAVENRFIIQWKNGRSEIIENQSREQVLQNIVRPNIDEIAKMENDQIIEISPPPSSGNIKSMSKLTANSLVNWGVTRIQAPGVWTQNYKGQNVVVAVIDSGVDVEHPQIRNQVALNTKEIPDNSVDDDNNGLVDDYKGYDFYENTGAISDPSGHGTHVAGTIAAQHPNSPDARYPLGVAPSAKILALKFMGNGSGRLSDAIRAIDYAVYARGAKIINASWGGRDCSSILKQKIADIEQQGVVFVTAAGNEGEDITYTASFPAGFDLGNIISVGASTASGYMADYSNFSDKYVHVLAPGSDIFQTMPGQSYAFMDGTSMASPHIAGVVALLRSKNPSISPSEIKRILQASAVQANFPVSSKGEVDALAAIAMVPAKK